MKEHNPAKHKKAKRSELLMTKERIKWYLNQIDNPGFWIGLGSKEARDAIRKKLVKSLKHYKLDIPEILR